MSTNSRIRKWMAVALCAAFAVPTTACGGRKLPPSDTIDTQYEWLDETKTDSSQLSDYAGQVNLDLVAWNTNQTGGYKKYTSSDDIVSEEIERITGVSISDKSYDNGGVTADVKYTQIQATGDYPDIAYGTRWLDPNAVWDLTDLIDKYCPTIKARMPASVWDQMNINGGQDGKVFAIPYGLGNIGLSEVDPTADPQDTIMFEFINEYYPYVVVREDILCEAYPEAKTVDEINEIFKNKGGFTEEELFDVEITSAAQFRNEFLPKIQHVIETSKNEDGTYRYQIASDRWVKPMLVTEGADRDNWSFMGVLIPKLLGATATHTNNYFSYWDVSTQNVELMFKQDYYKEEVRAWADLIAQGDLVSTYGMTDTYQRLQSELNRGYFAIGYQSSLLPAGNQATYAGINGVEEVVKYRKVYLKIEKDDEHFEYFVNGEAAPSGICFFKKSVREDDLPQLLRWLDFQASRLGDRLMAWGPQSAGLWEEREVDGKTVRQFKSEELANQMVYSTAVMGKDVQRYNLSNGTVTSAQPVFPFFYNAGSVDHPKCVYDLSGLSDLAMSYFSSGIVCQKESVKVAKTAAINAWSDTDMEGIDALWTKRELIEDAMSAVLTAGGSDADFERKYEDLLAQADVAGWTDDFFHGKFKNRFLEFNENYLDGFLK